MFYMITWGATQIEEAYVGIDPEDVIHRARCMINKWPEYEVLETEDLINLLLKDDCEFDLVQIQAEWQGYELSEETIVNLYERYSIPPSMYAEKLLSGRFGI